MSQQLEEEKAKEKHRNKILTTFNVTVEGERDRIFADVIELVTTRCRADWAAIVSVNVKKNQAQLKAASKEIHLFSSKQDQILPHLVVKSLEVERIRCGVVGTSSFPTTISKPLECSLWRQSCPFVAIRQLLTANLLPIFDAQMEHHLSQDSTSTQITANQNQIVASSRFGVKRPNTFSEVFLVVSQEQPQLNDINQHGNDVNS